MLNGRKVAALLGGGAGLVCSAATALGQIHGIPVEDPTEEQPFPGPSCTYHLLPASSANLVGDLPSNPMGWLGNTWDPPSVYSWLNTNPTWTPDRRPMMTVQLGSSSYVNNPRANPDEWWIKRLNSAGQLQAENAEDQYSVNMNFASDIAWVPGANGIPDQFDFLIRTILRWKEYGVRRVMLHLPAGVIYGKLVGYDFRANGTPYFGGPHDPATGYVGASTAIYGGASQSMNQFLGMPGWKQDYFQGQPLNMGTGFGPMNGWQSFMQTYCNPANSDHMDIEVYIGGGVAANLSDLGTETTVAVDAYQLVPSWTGTFDGLGEPIQNYFWAERNLVHTPPFPIDPRWETITGEPRQISLRLFWGMVSPWFSSIYGRPPQDQFCKIKRIWLDTASENTVQNAKRFGALEVAHNPYLRSLGVHIGGEALPTNDVGSSELMDDCAVGYMPWFANFQAISFPNENLPGTREFKPYVYTTLSRNNTEVHIMDNTQTLQWHQWKELRERGYIVGAWNGYDITAERMKRWYSIGNIRVADFDGDGQVMMTDEVMAITAVYEAMQYRLSHGVEKWPTVFGQGDFNNDGIISLKDLDFFYEYYSETNGHTRTEKFGYGTGNPDNR